MSRRDDDQHPVDLGDLDVIDAGGDPGVDEELPGPAGGGRVYSRRARVLVAAVIAITLVALVVGRALTTGGARPTASISSPSASAGTAPPDASPTRSDQGEVQQSARCGGLPCGQQVDQEIDRAVPPTVLTAVRSQYRGARIVAGRNVLDSDATTLLYRRVVARSGIRTITLTVVPYRTGDSNRGGYTDDGSGSSVYFEQRLGNWQVSVRVIAPVGTHLTLGPPMRLAQDARILGL